MAKKNNEEIIAQRLARAEERRARSAQNIAKKAEEEAQKKAAEAKTIADKLQKKQNMMDLEIFCANLKAKRLAEEAKKEIVKNELRSNAENIQFDTGIGVKVIKTAAQADAEINAQIQAVVRKEENRIRYEYDKYRFGSSSIRCSEYEAVNASISAIQNGYIESADYGNWHFRKDNRKKTTK